MKKLFLSFVSAFIVCSCAFSVNAASFYSYKDQLNTNEWAFYQVFESLDFASQNGASLCAEEYGLERSLSYDAFVNGSKISQAEISSAAQSGYDAAYMDNLIPFFTKQAFRLNYSISSSGLNSRVSTILLYSGEASYIEGFSSENVAAETIRLAGSVTAIAEEVNRFSSDYDKIRCVHEYLIKNVSYSSGASEVEHTAYGALINGSAVCEGYAKAMKMILNYCGVDCVLVRGVGSTDTISHMWNYVLCDGNWYLVDATWDDGGQTPLYRHFLLGSGEADKSYSPQGRINAAFLSYPPLSERSYERLAGDINEDGRVNSTDLTILLSAYGKTDSYADISGDGLVSSLDLTMLLKNYGRQI